MRENDGNQRLGEKEYTKHTKKESDRPDRVEETVRQKDPASEIHTEETE